MESSWISINIEALRSSFWVYSIASSNVTVKDIYKWRSADSPQTFSGLSLYLDGGRVQEGPEKGETQEGTLRQDLIPGQSGLVGGGGS